MPYIGAGIQRFNTADGLTVNGNAEVTGTTALTGNATAAGTLDVTGSITSSANATITTAGNSAQLTLASTDDDANVGPLLSMFRNSSSPADSDLTGKIEFNAEDSAGNATTYTSINSRIRDVTNGTEDGELKIEVRKDGTNRESLTLKEDETVFNEAGVDTDFRVESNGNANMLFVDAGNNRVGVGTKSTSTQLHVSESGSANATQRIQADADGYAELHSQQCWWRGFQRRQIFCGWRQHATMGDHRTRV